MEQNIRDFLDAGKVAVAGVSRTAGNWGADLMREFLKKDLQVTIVHPEVPEIEGIPCVKSLADLSDEWENLLVALPPEKAIGVLKELGGSSVKRVWLQNGAGGGKASPEMKEVCEKAGVELIHSLCPMMFLVPESIHKFHFNWKKFFRSLPKEYVAVQPV